LALNCHYLHQGKASRYSWHAAPLHNLLPEQVYNLTSSNTGYASVLVFDRTSISSFATQKAVKFPEVSGNGMPWDSKQMTEDKA